MKSAITIVLLIITAQSFSQKRAQTVALIPKNFTISPNTSHSQYGKALCLEVQHRAPQYSDSYAVEMLNFIEVVIDGAQPISLAEAESKKLVHLKQSSLDYSFMRGENLSDNSKIEINMKGSLYDNIVAPKGINFDKTTLPDEFKDKDILSKLGSAQDDIWFNQIKRDLFNLKQSPLETNNSLTIKSSTEEFINNVAKVLDDQEICKPSEVQLCLTKGEAPSVSLGFQCRFGREITISTEGDITVGRSIENKYISLSQSNTFKVYDQFKQDISLENRESNDLCDFSSVCFSIRREGLPFVGFPDCSLYGILKGELTLTDNDTGRNISLKLK